MDSMASLYQQHIAKLQQHARTVLERHQLDALLIHSGEPISLFLDDQDYPFKANPHFKAWVPVTQVPHCWLLVDGVNKPKLWFYSPVDYWYCVAALPESFWTTEVDLQPLRKADDIASQLPANRQNMAYIGSKPERALSLGIGAKNINPESILNYLHFHRSYKSEYEVACMREAQKVAIMGHHAAFEAFQAGMSEFDINMAYLMATGHRDTDVPYHNIVALNEHAAVLHYTEFDQTVPEKIHSFLIDAGAEYNGYAADLTRTYAAKGADDFAALISAINEAQQALIGTIQAGVRFTDYHLQMHQRLAKILKSHNILTNISEDAIIEKGLTSPFLPHGLGHPLGLQVHDVAGFMQDETGTHLVAPANHPYLRCTRILEPGMVMTIEPGLYFIETLLAPWRAGEHSAHFNWQRIDAMKPFGGIRIEDNIVIRDKRVENMTRDLLLA